MTNAVWCHRNRVIADRLTAGTAGAGALLSLLRERSGSLAAPVLLHLAANCAAPLASVLARWPASWPGLPADMEKPRQATGEA